MNFSVNNTFSQNTTGKIIYYQKHELVQKLDYCEIYCTVHTHVHLKKMKLILNITITKTV